MILLVSVQGSVVWDVGLRIRSLGSGRTLTLNDLMTVWLQGLRVGEADAPARKLRRSMHKLQNYRANPIGLEINLNVP